MRRLILAALMALGLANLTIAQTVSPGAAASGPSLYTGQVGRHTGFPNQSSAATSANAQGVMTPMVAIGPSNPLSLKWCNCYVNVGASGVEQNSPSTETVTVSIQYPIGTGTWTALTFGGGASSSFAAAPGGDIAPDPITTVIPAGAPFLWRMHVSAPSGLVYNNPYPSVHGLDLIEFNNANDKTLSGASISANDGFGFPPYSVTARTTAPSLCIVGDSREVGPGEGNVATPQGYAGESARIFGPSFGYANLGIPSDRVNWALSNYAKRGSDMATCTHAVVNYGTNDLQLGSRTATQLIADLNSFAALYPSVGMYGLTIAPRTTGAWSLADGSDQTVMSSESNRTTANDAMRNGSLTRYRGVFDQARYLEITFNGGKWIAGYTTDGIHEAAVANDALYRAFPQAAAEIKR